MKKTLSVLISLAMISSMLVSCLAAETASASRIVSEAPVDSYGERSALVSENYALAREAATEGIVLLENNGALPLTKNNSVTLFGIGSKRLIKGGSGSGLIYTKYFSSLIDGMKNAEKAGLITLNDGVNQIYEDHYAAWLEQHKDITDIARESKEISEVALTDEQVSAARAVSDTAIYTISRVSGEGGDRKAVKGDYYISDIEAANLAKINDAGFDKFIVILNAGTAVDTSFIHSYPEIDALVFAWLPGLEGGNALADVLCGEVSPSGKLVDTLAKSFDDYPTSTSFYESNAYVNYSEDIFVGYRYFETFDPTYEKVNYCFGYGMSYTSFELSSDSVVVDGENIKVSVKVKNTGNVAGKEVVQVYYSAPQGLLGKPAKELAGYAKTELLAPNKSQTLTISFPINEMSSFDDLGKTGNKAAYVLEAGDYNIYIGNSVKNAGERGIKGTYTLDNLVVTEQLTSLMTPKSLKTRLTASGEYESLNLQETETDGSYKMNLSNGSVLLEIEDYHRASEGVEAVVVPELSNLKYVSGLSSGAFLEYDLTFDNECVLGITLSYASQFKDVSYPFNVFVNGTRVSSVNTIPKTGLNGTNPLFKETHFASVVFNAGKNTLRIESANSETSAVYLDSLLFNTTDDLPRLSSAQTTIVEAEDTVARFDNGDTALPISEEKAFGETLVAKITKKGKYLEYNLYCEEAGSYEMLFAYAATRNYSTPLSIIINGVTQNVSYTMAKTSPEGTSASNNSAAFYNTSAWMDTPFVVNFPKGFITLRLLANEGCPNLNKFSFTKRFDLPEGYSLIKSDVETVLQAEDYAVANSDAEGTNTITKVVKNGETILNYLSSTNGGRYLEYKLYFEEAGTYNLTINCAANGNVTSPFSFFANGEQIFNASYVIPKTSPENAQTLDEIYHTYKSAITLAMAFPKGEVTFKVLCNSPQTPNLNYFVFTPHDGTVEIIPEGFTEITADSAVTIEAENFSRNSGKDTMNSRSLTEGASAGEKIVENIHGGDWLEYDLWFAEEGTYEINFNYASTTNYTNPYVFYVNDTELTHEAYSMSTTSTGTSTYDRYFVFVDTTSGVKLNFPKGRAVFKLFAGGNVGTSVPNLNKFTIKKTYNVPEGYVLLSPSVNAVTTVEAENYTAVNNEPYSAQGDIATRNRTDVPGITFLEYLTSTDGGRWLEYKLYAPKAGRYNLVINFASNSASTNPFTFLVDGTPIDSPSYTLPKTSAEGATTTAEIYFQFKDSAPISITLPSGAFTFRVLCAKGQMPNLNCFNFAFLEEIATPEPDPSTTPDSDVDPTLELDYAEDTSRIISYLDVMNNTETMDDFLAQLTNLDLVRLAGGHPPVTGSSSSMGRLRKYDIPEVTTSDGGAGIRINANFGATCWPCSTMLACTWNEPLIERVGEAIGKEAADIRLDCWLAPGMNIHRNPLCGRNFEYFSEDPLITGICASRITIGAKKYGLHTVAKHFAVNNKETNRSNSDSRVSERALREIYLKGFEILVKTADPRYIMTSYNLINGVEAAESYDLNTAILRNEWGFNGIVMTDWMNNSTHMDEIKAGNNIKKQTGDINGLLKQIKNGSITREELKENARVILVTLMDTMSARLAAVKHPVNRDGVTYIKGVEFNFVNDDHLAVVAKSYSKNGFSYTVGDYAEGGAWSLGLLFEANGNLGMNIPSKIANDNLTFENRDYFAEYIINVEQAGAYKLEFFVSGDGASVIVDDVSKGRVYTTATTKPAVFKRTEPVIVELSQGTHSIKIHSTLLGHIAISPYDSKVEENIDCKVFSKCDSEWGLTYTTQSGEKGQYTHIVPDFEDPYVNRRTDHWSLKVDESIYRYVAFCYRTNFTGECAVDAVKTWGTEGYDDATYYFTPSVTDKWTTSIVPITNTMTFNQLHFSPFGVNALNIAEDAYFDLLHYAFFKTESDAIKYCKRHADLPVSGEVITSREFGEKLYDDISNKYQSSAIVSLSQNGKTVAQIAEQDSAIISNAGKSSFKFGFDVPDGEYTLTVKKPGYITHSQSITVLGSCEVGAITLTPGDITGSFNELFGDGVVDIDDFIRMLRAFSPSSSLKLRMLTDIDEDGSVTVSDLSLIKTFIN